MTKKHYEMVAKAIKGQRPAPEDKVAIDINHRLDALAEDLCEGFAADNSLFNADKFMKATGAAQ